MPESLSPERTPTPAARAPAAAPDERDRQLVAALGRGERAALAELYDRHAPTMLGLAIRILRDRGGAEDLVHDVFVEAWKRASAYDPRRGRVETWLLLRVRSRAIDRLRTQRVARDYAEAEAREAPVQIAADAGAEGRPDRARAVALLAALPSDQRSVIELTYFEGLSGREVAERCGLPLGTVKSRLSAALRKLRGQLAADATCLGDAS